MKSLNELNAIKDKYKNDVNIRTSDYDIRIIVGMGNSGIVAGARDILKALVKKVEDEGLSGKVIVTQEARVSKVGYNPVVRIIENHTNIVTYVNVTVEKAYRIVEEHIKNGKIVEEYTLENNQKEEV
ncbi:MAG: (2Fe-2S) ferredoxin domain-containing protein [Eubacterium sp.]